MALKFQTSNAKKKTGKFWYHDWFIKFIRVPNDKAIPFHLHKVKNGTRVKGIIETLDVLLINVYSICNHK